MDQQTNTTNEANSNQTIIQKLQQKNIKLQETLKKERDMMDILGHELRTPLTIAKNATKTLKKHFVNGTLSKEILEKYLDMSEENLIRESQLLETLLSTTKIDKAGLGLQFEKVDIIDVINDAIEGVKDKVAKKGLQIKFNKPMDVIYVLADRSRMQEIADNLFDNAVKYTERGFISIIVTKIPGKVQMEIQDTGIGMTQEEIEKLGQKFYRTNTYLESSKDAGIDIVRPGGTGLGLYVTYSLVKEMGGTINVNSTPGKGSSFIVTVPEYNEKNHSIQEEQQPDRLTVFEKFEKLKKERERIVESPQKENPVN